MSDTEPKAAEAAPPKKKKKKLMIVVIGLVGVLAGAGGGIYASGMLGGGNHAEAKEDENKPKLKIKEGADEEAAEAWEAKNEGKTPDPKLFQATYYPLKEPMTANLADSDAFIQIGVGISTYYDEQVTKAVETHEMAVRSAVLMTLSEQDAMAVTTVEGRDELKKELKKAINDVLKAKEGFGGIDDVYFTSFVVQ